MFIIGQIVGAVAFAFEVATFQCKTAHRFLLMQLAANLLWLTSYAFLGAFTGAALVILAVIRIVTFYVLEKSARRKRFAALAILCAAAVAVAILTWKNWTSILALLGWLSMTLALFQKRPQISRRFGMVQGFFWALYDVTCRSIFGVGANVLSLVSAGFALWRFRKTRQLATETVAKKVSRKS